MIEYILLPLTRAGQEIEVAVYGDFCQGEEPSFSSPGEPDRVFITGAEVAGNFAPFTDGQKIELTARERTEAGRAFLAAALDDVAEMVLDRQLSRMGC